MGILPKKEVAYPKREIGVDRLQMSDIDYKVLLIDYKRLQNLLIDYKRLQMSDIAYKNLLISLTTVIALQSPIRNRLLVMQTPGILHD